MTAGKGGGPGKLTPWQKEMIVSGHSDLSNGEVARLYNVSKPYVWQLRNGVRGVGSKKRADYRYLKFRTANEHKFYTDFLAHAVPLLRSTLRAEQEMRRTGVFNTEISAEKQERKYAKAQEAEPRGEDRDAVVPVPQKPAYVPQAGKRQAGENAEGFLLDTRRPR